ncbi:MAG: class I SAM-dependent methyltransferase [Bacilli bacterium]
MKLRYDDIQGVDASEIGWVPTILHILRRRAILDAVSGLTPGNMIELGCGVGTNLYEFHEKGYNCKGIDRAEDAINMAKRIFNGIEGLDFDIEASQDDAGKYDYLMAIEVLEHNENELMVLNEWKSFLKPNGKLILSVPAHPEMWSASDEWAGHYRRYSYSYLQQTLEQAGFDVDHIISYGYPLANWMHPLRKYANKIKLNNQNQVASKEDATNSSGTNRRVENAIYPLYSNKIALTILGRFCENQKKYYTTNKGVGYLALATRKW